VQRCPDCRPGRQCRPCHAVYMRQWRLKEKQRVLGERRKASSIHTERDQLKAALGLSRLVEKYANR